MKTTLCPYTDDVTNYETRDRWICLSWCFDKINRTAKRVEAYIYLTQGFSGDK